MAETTTPTRSNGSNGAHPLTREAFEDATAYPLLTDDMASYDRGGSAAVTGGGSGTAAIGRVVDGAIRDVLAWRPKEGDPKGFVSALTQAFELYDVEGHTEWKWVQRSYAIDAELGAVTGAQASIYARARSFLDQAMPLLNGLKPLRPDFDPEDTEAARAIATSSLTELVNELGQEGGPRISRVDQLFELLLGRKDDPNNSEKIAGQLGLIKGRFGLSRGFVKTITEEETLTNFLILVDGVRGLHFTWKTQRTFFDRKGNDVFLGTQAVLLSRALGVISERVRAVNYALDSVFIGAAERQVTPLQLPDDSTIFIGELLSWIDEFATDEGPRLIRDGGKDGVVGAFVPTVNKLYRLTREAATASAQGTSGLPGFHTPRVRRALEDLTRQLGEALELSLQLRADPPRIDSVTATRDTKDPAKVTIEAKGLNLEHTATARIEHATGPRHTHAGKVEAGATKSRVVVTFKLPDEHGKDDWRFFATDEEDIDVRSKPFPLDMTDATDPGNDNRPPADPNAALPKIDKATFTDKGLLLTGANLDEVQAVRLQVISSKDRTPTVEAAIESATVEHLEEGLLATFEKLKPADGIQVVLISAVLADGRESWPAFPKSVPPTGQEFKHMEHALWKTTNK